MPANPATIPFPAQPAPKPVPLLLDQPAAIEFLGLSRSGWFRLKAAGRLPRPVSVPGAGVGQHWRRRDLERFVEGLKAAR
jgi:predicted DNA-binding transcriptional regulator AlpA